QWNRPPKVLFAAADESEFPAGTIEAHLLALYRALEPWAYRDWIHNGWRADYPIEVIPRASVEEIRSRCLASSYTHVHILAHGQPLGDADDRFGVRLHDSKTRKMKVVTGEQIAQAVRAGCRGREASDPVFVSLATCDSANVGSIVVPGGSVAHEL